jgi:hypothetical protein
MHEPCMSLKTGAVTVNIDQHPIQVDEAIESLQINIDQDHDALTRHLPPELVSHIFTIYTENFNSSFDIQQPSAECGPLLLGAVSKLWREVAFGTPQLWNTINFQSRSLDLNKIKTKIELVKQWVDRSSQLPLYISLGAEAMHTKQLWGPIFNLIRNCAPRWHTLVLDTNFLLYSAFLDGLTCAPHLHTLKLINTPIYSPSNSHSYDPFHLQTPSFKHLAIINLGISSIAVEWGNITHFESNGLRIDDFFETLRLAERLTSCKLYYLINLHRHPLPTTPLIHSALKRLHLPPVGNLEYFIDLLVFPSLAKFRYKLDGMGSFSPDCLISLFNRSGCQLTHFDLLSEELLAGDVDGLISLFFALPTLTHLKFEELKYPSRWCEDSATMTDKLLQKLMPIEGIQPGLLPCLQSLKFRGKQKFSWNCLADFIIARLMEDNKMAVSRNLPVFRRNGHSIRFVSFIVRGCTQAIDLDTRAHFNRARDAGVSIEIVDELLRRAL